MEPVTAVPCGTAALGCVLRTPIIVLPAEGG